MRKILFFILLFFVGLLSFSQTYYEKYNSINGRYEYYDKQTNRMVAFKTYNSINKTWETTYVNGNQQSNGRYIPQNQRTDDNFALLQQVMAKKQASFDSNYQKIQNHINSINLQIFEATEEPLTRSLIEDFDDCVKTLNNKKYDFSSNSKTIEVINYLTNCHMQSFKKRKFDLNYQKVQEHIKSTIKKASESTNDTKLTNQIKTNFSDKCANPIKNTSYDYSSDTKTAEIIDYITSCYNQVVLENKFNSNSRTNHVSQSKTVNSPDSPLINGGYITNQILEYKYNQETEKYDLVFDEKIHSKLFFTYNQIHFKRGENRWLFSEWTYQGFDEDKKHHIFFDKYNQTITFDKNFDTISWYAEPKDNVFQKIFVYKYLTKEDSVYPNYSKD